MKKIGILTIHMSYNYGAALQAYATLKNFQDLGCDAEFVNYSTELFENLKKFIVFPKDKTSIKHNIRNICYPKLFIKRKRAFERFFSNNYKTSGKNYTEKNYNSIADEDYDYLVTGSDQTFNLNLHEGEDWNERKAFFLPFRTKGKKISYSSSMGDHFSEYTEEQKKFMTDTLNDYDEISVREEKAADFIENIIGKKPKVLYDPTLSLSREDWDKVCAEPLYDKKYILFYTVLSADWVVEYVKKISKETGLDVIAVHPQNSLEIGCDFIRASCSGPSEFLSYIKNAEYVITTSFHGTVFSTIYKRPFYSLVIGDGTRISNLLTKASLDNRIIREGEEKMLDFNVTDFESIDGFLHNVREHNINFIKSALND